MAFSFANATQAGGPNTSAQIQEALPLQIVFTEVYAPFGTSVANILLTTLSRPLDFLV